MIVPIMTRECPNCHHVFGGEEMRAVIREEMEVEMEALGGYENLLDYLEGKSFLELTILCEIKGYKKFWIMNQLNTLEELKQFGEYMGYNPKWFFHAKKSFVPRTVEQRKEEFNNWRSIHG
jgi:hypothetical protein